MRSLILLNYDWYQLYIALITKKIRMNYSLTNKTVNKSPGVSVNSLLVLMFLLLSLTSKSQDSIVHTRERVTILSGVNVYIMGSLTDLSTSEAFANLGTIHLQGDLRNNGSVNIFGASTAGTLRFFGGTPSTNARILGAQTINLKNFIIDLANPALSGNVLLRSNKLKALCAISNPPFKKLTFPDAFN